MALEMGRPRPVPPWVRLIETSAWVNRSNSRLIASGAMPGPVSETSTLSSGPVFEGRQLVFTCTEPCGVNFTALDRKLSSTCLSRVTSPWISSGMAGSSSSLSSTPLAAAWMARSPVASSASRRGESGWISSSAWPASSLERSSTSLMIESSASLAS